MSAFNPGTGGSLKTTSLPGALIELAALIGLVESSPLANVEVNNVTFAALFDSKMLSLNATLPITVSSNASGDIVVQGVDYLTASGVSGSFNNGGGDLESTNKVAAFLELAYLLHDAEKASTAEEPPDNIQISLDFETLTANIQATLPITYLIDQNGLLSIRAEVYV